MDGAADVGQGTLNTYNIAVGNGKEAKNFMQEGYKWTGKAIGGETGEQIANGMFIATDIGLGFVTVGGAVKHISKLQNLATKTGNVAGDLNKELAHLAQIYNKQGKGTVAFSSNGAGELQKVYDTLAEYAKVKKAAKGTDKSNVNWNNGWRTSDGKFASPNGPGKSGADAEQQVWDAIKNKDGWQVIEGRVSVRDATSQLRVYDGVAVSPSGRNIGLEVKSGSAIKTTSQRNFDTRLNSSKTNQAYGVGQSQGIIIDRTIEIRR